NCVVGGAIDLGFMPAAVITHIVNRIVYPNGKQTLKEIVLEAKKVGQKLFKDFPSLEELNRCIDLAIELSENDADDLENIHKLGEGWVAEEAMAIAIYCALKYENDFSKGIIVAANHNGDSDSTAAICGNILGAICGYQAIEAQKKWTECLELRDVIIELANDLYRGCPMMAGSIEEDETWLRKYVEMRKA
ncbi:MAG: ADP-ribosylglycohydrolase family protein, partial [Acetatifactor sp.]|nr:ADP-ribosylglycohydrolase family protein [Acetatifactor sp.]